MKALNFDTTFTKGKRTYTIVKNEVAEVVDGKREEYSSLSGAVANALIEHWLDGIIVPQVTSNNPANASFDEIVKAINYLEEALGKVNRMKSMNCSYRNKSREELRIRVYSIGSRFYDKINWTSLTTSEQLVLKGLSNRSTDVSSSDLQELYNPVTDDSSKITKWWKELNAFNYKKYGIDKKSLLESRGRSTYIFYGKTAKDAYDTVLKRIEQFRAVLAEAGDDLLNWSDQKITLRCTKLGLDCKAWELAYYTTQYNEHLRSKGIVVVDKKKATSKGKLEELVEKGNPTQDDLFRYFKQSTNTCVLAKLDLEHLFLIIDSNLKCVTKRLFDRWAKPQADFNKIAQLLCEKSETKEDFKRIFKWATPNHVTELFMIKHKDHSNTTEVMQYCEVNEITTNDNIDDEFYQTCLTKIHNSKKYTLNRGLTYQYMVRMNHTELVSILKQIANSDKILLELNTLYGLYREVDYSLIKDTILSDKLLLNKLSLKLVKENDNASMVTCCDKVGGQLYDQYKVAIFNQLTFDEKKAVILKDGSKGFPNFTGAIKLLTNSECLKILTETINDGRSSKYTTAIFKQLVNSGGRYGILEANKIVKGMDDPGFLPLDETVICSLLVDTKIELLNNGICLKDMKVYYSYYDTVEVTSYVLGNNFFNDFNREDINKVYDSPVESEYRKFLAHTMTKDELESCASAEIRSWHKGTNAKDLQESFFRHNLELLGYGFLKQFKDKVAFRVVVGDQRDRSNKSFAQNLFSKLKVSNAIDFMFQD